MQTAKMEIALSLDDIKFLKDFIKRNESSKTLKNFLKLPTDKQEEFIKITFMTLLFNRIKEKNENSNLEISINKNSIKLTSNVKVTIKGDIKKKRIIGLPRNREVVEVVIPHKEVVTVNVVQAELSHFYLEKNVIFCECNYYANTIDRDMIISSIPKEQFEIFVSAVEISMNKKALKVLKENEWKNYLEFIGTSISNKHSKEILVRNFLNVLKLFGISEMPGKTALELKKVCERANQVFEKFKVLNLEEKIKLIEEAYEKTEDPKRSEDIIKSVFEVLDNKNYDEYFNYGGKNYVLEKRYYKNIIAERELIKSKNLKWISYMPINTKVPKSEGFDTSFFWNVLNGRSNL